MSCRDYSLIGTDDLVGDIQDLHQFFKASDIRPKSMCFFFGSCREDFS